jgi:hypothetical protein
MSAYCAGFWIGAFGFISVFVVIYWFVGRFGWFGLLVRIICAIFIAFRVFALIFHPPICTG